jgi:hypothetical protein
LPVKPMEDLVMRLPCVRYSILRLMALVEVMAVPTGVALPSFRDPSTPQAVAPMRPNRILMEGVDINWKGRDRLRPNRPSRERSLLPPNPGSLQRP